MNFDEFKILVRQLKTAYISDRFIPNKESAEDWFDKLKDINYEQAQIAINEYILNEAYPPSIAEIRKRAKVVNVPNKPDVSKLPKTIRKD